jgi:hypothetical protein
MGCNCYDLEKRSKSDTGSYIRTSLAIMDGLSRSLSFSDGTQNSQLCCYNNISIAIMNAYLVGSMGFEEIMFQDYIEQKRLLVPPPSHENIMSEIIPSESYQRRVKFY